LLRRYRDFCDFQDGSRRHLGFSKISNYNGALKGVSMRQFAKFYQNRLSGCGDMAI